MAGAGGQMQDDETKTVYERLGGHVNIETMVEMLYIPLLSSTFGFCLQEFP